jgi:hypothetical protein
MNGFVEAIDCLAEAIHGLYECAISPFLVISRERFTQAVPATAP